MNMSLRLICPTSEAMQYKNVNPLLSRPSFTRVSCFMKRNVCNRYDGRNTSVYCQLMHDHLEESYKRKKKLELPLQTQGFVRTLLIDNYDSYTYNIYQELSVINGVPPVVIQNDDWTWEELCYYLYEENAFDNIVLSPGPGSPACPEDIGICLQILRECRDIPILGVCLGHQALGYVHGAQVVHASEPVHGRLSEVEHNGCQLFQGIPSGRNSGFKVVRYHSLVIDSESLPEVLIPIAWTSRNGSSSLVEYGQTRNARVLMGVKHSTRPHYGVQFHPESVATCHGSQIFKNFREITDDYWLRCRSSYNKGKHANSDAHAQVSSASRLYRHLVHNNTEVNYKSLKLKWRKFDHLAGQVGGAKSIFCQLFGQEAENTFWLDSSSTEMGRARFSFMGGKGGSLWKQLTFRLSDQSDGSSKGGGHLSLEDSEGCVKTIFLEGGFLDYLNKELQSYRYEKDEYEGLPFDFHGGYVGYIG